MENRRELDSTKSDLSEKNKRIDKLNKQLSDITAGSIFSELEGMVEQDDGLEMDLETMKQRQHQQEMRYRLALEEIKELRNRISVPEQYAASIDELKQKEAELSEQLTILHDKLSKSEECVCNLESELKCMTQLANESQVNVNMTQDGLNQITKNIAKIYHLVCEANGETPNRLMLEHAQGKKFRRVDSPKENEAPTSIETENGAQKQDGNADSTQDKVVPVNNYSKIIEEPKGDPTTCSKLVETINDQIIYLGRAVNRSVEINRQKQNSSGAGEDGTDVQEQILKLKAMLSTKREQIATLRSVLKANKATAESALSSLKQKYESEKIIVTETMQRLRNELKQLKEEAVNFQSMRGMFAQRCDEYVTQLEEQRRLLVAAEEEKKTLNSLLRMAIQQKLALTQKLEDVEFDRERKTMRQQRATTRNKLNKVSDAGSSGSSNHASHTVVTSAFRLEKRDY